MRTVYFDCEFIEDGNTIELLSLGAVNELGQEFYAVNCSANVVLASGWVQEHVLPQLYSPVPGGLDKAGSMHLQAAPSLIAHHFKQWVLHDLAPADTPQFWGYYCAYDWVAVCQMYGSMMQLPAQFPMLANDLRSWLNWVQRPQVRQPDDAPHHALLDARWIRSTHIEVSATLGAGV